MYLSPTNIVIDTVRKMLNLKNAQQINEIIIRKSTWSILDVKQVFVLQTSGCIHQVNQMYEKMYEMLSVWVIPSARGSDADSWGFLANAENTGTSPWVANKPAECGSTTL